MKKLILLAALPALLAGCYVAGQAEAQYPEGPPPPRYVVMDAQPGYVWVDGHWYWGQDQWLWTNGYYLVDRPGFVWVQGSYYGRRWRPGYWSPSRTARRPYHESQAGAVVRGGVRQVQPSRAGAVVQPSRAGSVATPSRAGTQVRSVQPSRTRQVAPQRSSTPSRSSGHTRVRDHR